MLRSRTEPFGLIWVMLIAGISLILIGCRKEQNQEDNGTKLNELIEIGFSPEKVQAIAGVPNGKVSQVQLSEQNQEDNFIPEEYEIWNYDFFPVNALNGNDDIPDQPSFIVIFKGAEVIEVRETTSDVY